MKLMCPLCGGETETGSGDVFACGRCGGWVRMVPNGKAWMLKAAEKPRDGEDQARPLLEKALCMEDPVKKKALLLAAEALCPDSLAVQTELMHLGRLDQRNPKRLDYHIIKCYLLHVFEEPEKETPAMRESMIDELTSDPRLLRCLELAPDREEYLTAYLTRLCREYIDLFFKGSSEHMRQFLGFQVVRPEKALAHPAAKTLIHMERASLPEPFDRLLPACFLDAFRTQVGSDAFLQEARKELEG